MWKSHKKRRKVTHLQDISKLYSNVPFSGCQLILVKIKFLECCHGINGNMVSNSKFKHIKGGVLSCWYILWHHIWSKPMSRQHWVPCWKELCYQVLECNCNFAELDSTILSSGLWSMECKHTFSNIDLMGSRHVSSSSSSWLPSFSLLPSSSLSPVTCAMDLVYSSRLCSSAKPARA